MTAIGYAESKAGYKVIANYELTFPYIHMELEEIVKLPDELRDAVVLIDEVQEAADNREWFKGSNKSMATFAKQLRKRNVIMFATTQIVKEVDIRLRRQIDNIVFSTPIHDGKFYIEVYEYKGNQTKVKEFIFDGKPYFDMYKTDEIIVFEEKK